VAVTELPRNNNQKKRMRKNDQKQNKMKEE
jgi:hypothetical protein